MISLKLERANFFGKSGLDKYGRTFSVNVFIKEWET